MKNRKKRWWQIAAGVALVLFITVVLATQDTSIGKIEALPDIYGWMHRDGGHAKEGSVVSARFQFENRLHTHSLLSRISVSSIPMWQFMVLTNNGTGTFVSGFEPTIMNFEPRKAGRRVEFTVRDARLLHSEWKVRAIHRRRYKLPRPFSAIMQRVKRSEEVWESDVQHPLPLPLVSPSGSSNEPVQSEQPAFLTNGGTIFGDHKLRFSP